MEYLGKTEGSKDLVNKEYVDSKIPSGGSEGLFVLYKGALTPSTALSITFEASQLPSERCVPLFATWIDYLVPGWDDAYKKTGFCELDINNLTGDWRVRTQGRQDSSGYIIVVGVDLDKL